MLGRTAAGLFWMFRYLERCENIARLVEAGFRMGLTHTASASEWQSVVATAAARDAFLERHHAFTQETVTDFLLRDSTYAGSVLSSVEAARNNAREVRTALTREVWEAVNDCWLTLKPLLAQPVSRSELPATLGAIRHKSAHVRGALHGTMLRNDIFNFARGGTFVERADNTARILDVKYYVLLPSVSLVGSSLDNAQWETILRSASAERAFRWLHPGEVRPAAIVEFMALDRRMPRSLAYCLDKLANNLRYLEAEDGVPRPSTATVRRMHDDIRSLTVEKIFARGLHEFLQSFIVANGALARQIEEDYRFYR